MAAATAHSSRPIVQGYVLQERLGSGSFANVFKAKMKVVPYEVVAIKCISIKRLKRKESKDNLITEIKLMKELKHRHIVKLIDFEWDKNYIYLIMEYCEGGDLFHFIRRREHLPEDIARKFLQQLAVALKYLHDRGIAHLDLKPQNLLLTNLDNPILKISDFGVSQYLDDGQVSQSIRGSPLYMAPEVLLCQKYDSRVDLWSTGIILYELLYGKAPYTSSNFEELFAKAADSRPIDFPAEPELSEGCKDLLKRLLEKNVENRLTFDGFFSHPFVDLDHAPSHESLERSTRFLKEAVALDAQGKVGPALDKYQNGLEHLLLTIHYEDDPAIRVHLTRELENYMERAEVLKGTLKSKKLQQLAQEEKIAELWSTRIALKTALGLIRSAEKCEASQDYEGALKHYISAIDVIMGTIEEEDIAENKVLLKSKVTVLLSRAEELKVINKSAIPKLKAKNKLEGKPKCKIQ